MSSPHLQHLISWNSLQSLLVENVGEGLELPVDSEGRIHIKSRAVGIQVENRTYLQGRVCNDSSCAVAGTAIFYKRKKEQFSWKIRLRTKDDYRQMQYFVDSFAKAVEELGSTKLEKAKKAVADMTPAQRAARFTDELQERARSSFRGKWEILYELVAYGDLESILVFREDNVINVSEIFGELLGGQAVGNGFRFLVVHNLLPFYLESNMIIANNLQAQPDKWIMKYHEDGSLRLRSNDFIHDCDGRTFIEHLRPVLSKGVFMCDLERTQELLKQVFDVITTYYVANNLSSSVFCNLRSELTYAIRETFYNNFYGWFDLADQTQAQRIVYVRDT